MKRLRTIVWFGCVGLVITASLIGWGQWSDHKLRSDNEKTHRELRQEGFKIELSEFRLGLNPEVRKRSETIISVGLALRDLRTIGPLELMKLVGTNVALRTVPLEKVMSFYPAYFPSKPDQDLWPLLREELNSHQREMDEVCHALGSGGFRFEPRGSNGNFLLPYLADIKGLAQALATRATVNLHDRETNQAFTNLLALLQMATGWNPEPIEISHLVRFACVTIAYQALWEAMQCEGWNDDQLATLQSEWTLSHFFDGLPETAALSRASMVRICQLARAESFISDYGGWGPAIRQIGQTFTRSPMNGFRELKWLIEGYRNSVQYRNVGSYEDEKASLIYYRNRELELQRAIACSTWEAMRLLPGVTNLVAFQGAKMSRIGAQMNVKQASLGLMREGRSLMGRAAETETRRRLIMTALALKRFQRRYGSSPETLDKLVPEFLPSVPLDFMNGNALRYQRRAEGQSLLYSVGLDCVDNGGKMCAPEHLRTDGRAMLFVTRDIDIVWPWPASQADIEIFEREQEEQEKAIEQGAMDPAIMRAFRERYGKPVPAELQINPPSNQTPALAPGGTNGN